MKFFKHFVDAHRGRSIQGLLDELGHMGLTYWIIVEMCVEKLDEKLDAKGPGGRLTEADCEFNFHQRILRQNLRVSPTNLRKILGICGTFGLLSFEIDGNSVKISMPKILKSLERTKKKDVRSTSERRQNDVLEEDKEEDKDKEQEEETSDDESLPSKEPIRFASVGALIAGIPEKIHARWRELYPDPEFVPREILKAWGYYHEEKQKPEPRSVRGWCKALSTWLERGWGGHVRNLPAAGPRRAQGLDPWLAEADILINTVKQFGRDDAEAARAHIGEQRWSWFVAIGRSRIAEMKPNEWNRRELAKEIEVLSRQMSFEASAETGGVA